MEEDSRLSIWLGSSNETDKGRNARNSDGGRTNGVQSMRVMSAQEMNASIDITIDHAERKGREESQTLQQRALCQQGWIHDVLTEITVGPYALA